MRCKQQQQEQILRLEACRTKSVESYLNYWRREKVLFFLFFLSLDNNQFTSLHRPEQSIQLYPLILIIALLLHRLKIVILLKKFK